MTSVRWEDPLQPSPDEARELLLRELLAPEYHQDSVVQRLIDWLARLFDDTVTAASGLPPLVTFAILLAFLLLVIALIWLVTRVRLRSTRPEAEEGVLTDPRVPAAEYRRRAERAREDGRFGECVVEGFRAVTARQVERGRLDDLPAATAHEVAVRLEEEYAEHTDDVRRSAAVFDAVRYGDHAAGADDADAVLALDDALAGVR